MNKVEINFPYQFAETSLKGCQQGISSLAQNVHQFVMHNKGSVFLAFSVALVAFCSPELIALKAGCDLIAYSFLGVSAIQVFTMLNGRNEGLTHKTGEQMATLLAVTNCCILYLFPQISLSTSLFSGSIGAVSLLSRKLSASEG